MNPDRNTEADITLIDALVRVRRRNRWLAKGKYESVKDIATDEGTDFWIDPWPSGATALQAHRKAKKART